MVPIEMKICPIELFLFIITNYFDKRKNVLSYLVNCVKELRKCLNQQADFLHFGKLKFYAKFSNFGITK